MVAAQGRRSVSTLELPALAEHINCRGVRIVLIGLNALWRSSFLPLFERVQDFWSTVLALLAVVAVLAFGQLSWYLGDARFLGSPEVLNARASQAGVIAPGKRPRVIWIILDELSYEQVYERRFPSLALPAFDQLADQSTVFTQGVPAAIRTQEAVLSFMTGLWVDRIQANGDCTLDRIHDHVAGRWQPFHAQDTVFQDALNYGFRTAVVGWYNPYCRILSTVLDRCQWVFRENYDGGMSARASVSTNVLATWMDLLGHDPSRRKRGPDESREATTEAHLADYKDFVSGGDQLLGHSSSDFLLLHMPVPHPGGIYDRRTGTFTTPCFLHRQSSARRLLPRSRASTFGAARRMGFVGSRGDGRSFLANQTVLDRFIVLDPRGSGCQPWRPVRRPAGLYRQAAAPDYGGER